MYPFDRPVLLPKESKRVSLADKTGLKFIPLYSPACRQPSKSSAKVSHFSPEEIARYQACFKEGYDVPNEHYQQWVKMYHPESLSNTPSSPLVDLAPGMLHLSPVNSFRSLPCSSSFSPEEIA